MYSATTLAKSIVHHYETQYDEYRYAHKSKLAACVLTLCVFLVDMLVIVLCVAGACIALIAMAAFFYTAVKACGNLALELIEMVDWAFPWTLPHR